MIYIIKTIFNNNKDVLQQLKNKLFITIDSNDFPETHQVGLTRVERMLFLREEM